MTTDIIQAHFEELEAVASRFGQQSSDGDELISRVRNGVKALETGGWKGSGAEAFFGEMYGTVVPSMQRLSLALNEARSLTLDVKHFLQEAEEEAARLFSGNGGPNGASSGQGEGGSSSDAPADIQSSGKKLGGGLRLTGMQRENGELFVTGAGDGRDIHPSDADQGNLGDCFFISSLAAIAEQNPELIRQAIRANPDGTYTVTFYEDTGIIFTDIEPVEITVTPDFPTGERDVNGTMVPVTPHAEVSDRDASGKPEMWAMIMERAYAQWKGDGNAMDGYAKLNQGGRPEDAMFALTGRKSSLEDPDEYSIGELARMDRNGEAMVFSTLGNGEGGKKALYADGRLVTGHGYYVTGVDEAAGTVTVRNPWGWQHNEVTIPYDQLDDVFANIAVNPAKR
jgi:WXG100 family type VII secretion target